MPDVFIRTLKILAPLVTALFAVLAAYSSDEPVRKRRNSRIAAAGAVLSALVAVGLELGDQIGREQQAADELKRQRNLLIEVRRSAFAIDSIDVDLQYVISADRPSLSALIQKFDSFIAKNHPASYSVDLPKTSLDDYAVAVIKGTKDFNFHGGATELMMVPDQSGRARVMALTITDRSPLYPARDSREFRMLRPTMHLLFFRSHRERLTADLSGPIVPHAPAAELILELPLDREIGDVEIVYRPIERWLYVLPHVKAAEAVHDPGKVISVLDFANRKAALLSTPLDYGAVNVVALGLTLRMGNAPSWGRTKTYGAPELKMVNHSGQAVAMFGMKEGDFETAQGALNLPSVQSASP